jgi:hypothetical protein
MGEYVWTMVTIGGKASPEAIEGLKVLAESYFEEGDVQEALTDRTSLTLQGTRNYGNADETEELCQNHGLPYVLSWAAQPGCFESGIHYWRPGMEAAGEVSATDNGNPSIDLSELMKAAEEGKTLADVIEGLAGADPAAIPPLELIEEPETI